MPVRLPRPDDGGDGADDVWQYVLAACSAEELAFWVGVTQTQAASMTDAVLGHLMQQQQQHGACLLAHSQTGDQQADAHTSPPGPSLAGVSTRRPVVRLSLNLKPWFL